jgi:YbgC/YbaW family acyl-CoA thioester hydrolase
MENKTQYTVRFNDCDPFNHLNNSSYIDYLLNAREDHLKLNYNLTLASFYSKGIGWVVGSHEIMYARPAFYNEIVTVKSALIELSPEYLLVEMLMMNENCTQIKAVMWTKFITVNMQTGKREAHPEELLNLVHVDKTDQIDFEGGLKIRLSFLQQQMAAAKLAL